MKAVKIIEIAEKKLIGFRILTSLEENKTKNLWQKFMPRKKEISNNLNDDFYSVQIYPKKYFKEFSLKKCFEKWAAIEVLDFKNLPNGMETLILPKGKYAVFIYKGRGEDFFETANYIFGTWIPNSKFELDKRPHFEIMGEKYLGPQNPNSEETIWIPIKNKTFKNSNN